MVTRPRIKMEEEAIREKVIAGSAAYQEEKMEYMNFCLRIKTKTMGKIENIVDNMEGISRTGWILQAIQEKMKRDGVE